MAPVFLGARWVGEALQRYRERPPRATLKGKPIVFLEREYAAALLHIYSARGKSPSEVAALAQITPEELSFQRLQIDFLTLADHLKTRFTAWYREVLVLEDFSPMEYSDITREFLLLDEVTRTQIRVPLWTQLVKTGLSLQSKKRTGLSIDSYDLMLFRRLLSFFIFIDKLRPDASHQIIKEKIRPIARTFLESDLALLEEQAEHSCQKPDIKEQLNEDLKGKIGSL